MEKTLNYGSTTGNPGYRKALRLRKTLEKKEAASDSVKTQGQIAPTPRPWILGRGGDLILRVYGRGKGTHGNVVCQFGDGIDETLREYKRAYTNAELICRAVNSHDALVKTAQAIIACEYGAHPGQMYQDAIAEARKALALAGTAPSVPGATDNHLAAPVIP